jgi:hypothetical protein
MNMGMHSGRRRAAVVATLACALALLSCWKVDADLKLSTNRLDFGATRDQATFTVSNDSKDNALTTGVTLLDYQLKVDRPWVTVSPMAGKCGSDEAIEHTVTIDRSALPDGESLATIRVTSNGGSDEVAVRATEGVVAECDEPLTPLVLSSPDDGATGVALEVNLTWSGGESQCEGRTSTYDVYFGTNSSPPRVESVATGSFDVGNLAENTTYYWKVRASDGTSTRTSPVRQFKTTVATVCTEGPSAPSSLSPSDAARDVPVNQDLSWSGGESRCAAQTATYDVYFGTSSPAPLELNNGTSKSWDPGTLEGRKTYYWRIVAKDANGTSSSGEQHFTTQCIDDNGASLTAPCNPSPPDGKDNFNPKGTFTWGCGVTDCDREVTFTFYLGTSSGLDESDNVTTTTAHSYKPSELRKNTTYYWKVVAHAGITNRPGPVWHFKTKD